MYSGSLVESSSQITILLPRMGGVGDNKLHGVIEQLHGDGWNTTPTRLPLLDKVVPFYSCYCRASSAAGTCWHTKHILIDLQCRLQACMFSASSHLSNRSRITSRRSCSIATWRQVLPCCVKVYTRTRRRGRVSISRTMLLRFAECSLLTFGVFIAENGWTGSSACTVRCTRKVLRCMCHTRVSGTLL